MQSSTQFYKGSGVVRVPVTDLGKIEASINILEGLLIGKPHPKLKTLNIPDNNMIWDKIVGSLLTYKEIRDGTK